MKKGISPLGELLKFIPSLVIVVMILIVFHGIIAGASRASPYSDPVLLKLAFLKEIKPKLAEACSRDYYYTIVDLGKINFAVADIGFKFHQHRVKHIILYRCSRYSLSKKISDVPSEDRILVDWPESSFGDDPCFVCYGYSKDKGAEDIQDNSLFYSDICIQQNTDEYSDIVTLTCEEKSLDNCKSTIDSFRTRDLDSNGCTIVLDLDLDDIGCAETLGTYVYVGINYGPIYDELAEALSGGELLGYPNYDRLGSKFVAPFNIRGPIIAYKGDKELYYLCAPPFIHLLGSYLYYVPSKKTLEKLSENDPEKMLNYLQLEEVPVSLIIETQTINGYRFVSLIFLVNSAGLKMQVPIYSPYTYSAPGSVDVPRGRV